MRFKILLLVFMNVQYLKMLQLKSDLRPQVRDMLQIFLVYKTKRIVC